MDFDLAGRTARLRASEREKRPLDVVVFGATGDTGTAATCFLHFKAGSVGVKSWTAACRSLAKLQSQIVDQLPPPGPGGLAMAPPIQADASDPSSLLAMARKAKVVLAAAGPFAQYGEGVVRACIEAQTDYCDITGEGPWVDLMARKYGQEAEAKGVRLVSCAGFDSVPADLLTFLAADSLNRGGREGKLARMEAFVRGEGGGAAPTGTLLTAAGLVSALRSKAIYRLSCGILGKDTEVFGAGLLSPAARDRALSDLVWNQLPAYSHRVGFTGNCVMDVINCKVVRKSATELGYSQVRYRERIAFSREYTKWSLYGLVPTAVQYAVMAFVSWLACVGLFGWLVWLVSWANQPARRRLKSQLLDGFQKTGGFTVTGYGDATDGRSVRVSLSSHYDAGIGFTMISACAVAGLLAKRLPEGGLEHTGFLSPVVGVGGAALARALQKAGGAKIEVLDLALVPE